MRTVLKLGGSVITVKDRPMTVDEGALGRAARAVAASPELVIVHGGGSFGHHYAEQYGVSPSAGTTTAREITAIHGAMQELNGAVVERLQESEVEAVPVAPLSMGWRDDAGSLSIASGPLASMVSEGLVPVSHGDVVVNRGAGATILSGDELVGAIAEQVDADRIGICSDVPGVLDRDGEVIERVESYEAVDGLLGGSESTDVTGGMAGKVRQLLGRSTPAEIFDLAGLEQFLAGDAPGTSIGLR
mgnify:CR=1 FL=1|jgi:isopentenyl phosphate kinase